MNQVSFYKSKFNTLHTSKHAAVVLAEKIIDQTKKAIDEKGQCIWAISGGSSILKLYDALSDHKDFFETFGKFLIITWVDERVVPHTHQKSNYGNARTYFWKNFENVQLIPVPYDKEVAESANKYKHALEKEQIHRGDIDVMILGMGSDGHTASLFPFNERLKEETKDIVPVSDQSVDVERVSMTFPFINSSQNIFLYFYGEEKGKTIRDAIRSMNKEQYPILGIDWERVQIYTDQIL